MSGLIDGSGTETVSLGDWLAISLKTEAITVFSAARDDMTLVASAEMKTSRAPGASLGCDCCVPTAWTTLLSNVSGTEADVGRMFVPDVSSGLVLSPDIVGVGYATAEAWLSLATGAFVEGA